MHKNDSVKFHFIFIVLNRLPQCGLHYKLKTLQLKRNPKNHITPNEQALDDIKTPAPGR